MGISSSFVPFIYTKERYVYSGIYLLPISRPIVAPTRLKNPAIITPFCPCNKAAVQKTVAAHIPTTFKTVLSFIFYTPGVYPPPPPPEGGGGEDTDPPPLSVLGGKA